MGHTIRLNERIDPKSCLPGRSSIFREVKDLNSQTRNKFIVGVDKGTTRWGVAVINGAQLKI